jgi:hypothetical protein
MLYKRSVILLTKYIFRQNRKRTDVIVQVYESTKYSKLRTSRLTLMKGQDCGLWCKQNWHRNLLFVIYKEEEKVR